MWLKEKRKSFAIINKIEHPWDWDELNILTILHSFFRIKDDAVETG